MTARSTPPFRRLIHRLIRRRKQLGISQLEVNLRIGCTDALVAKWECGMKYPNMRHMLLWCDVLEVELTIEETD